MDELVDKSKQLHTFFYKSNKYVNILHFQGGIKAVVHTDVWQVIVMYISVLVVVIVGTVSIGGPTVVFDIAARGDRLVFAE